MVRKNINSKEKQYIVKLFFLEIVQMLSKDNKTFQKEIENSGKIRKQNWF